MIVLREKGNEALLEYQPDLEGLYVVGADRGHGIGTSLVRAGMKLAHEQEYEVGSATTVKAAGILERLVWKFIKTVQDPDGEISSYYCIL